MPLAEASLWADRYSAARRPAPPRAPFPALETAPDVLSATLHLVESLGPPSAPVRVRLIQDIHRHAQAQRFISEAIGAMASGDDRSLVAVEGAWTATDVSPFREPDLAAVLRPMADALRNESQREMIEEKLARYLNVNEVELLTEWVTPAVDVESYRDEPHLLGELITMINQLREAPDTLEGIAPASLAGLQGDPAERRQYVMSLLRDIESEAVVRLLQDNRHAH